MPKFCHLSLYLPKKVRRKRCLFVLIWHLQHIYSAPPTPQGLFIECMESATSSVAFSFNDTMYKQTDGVAMGPPLGPALVNIFVGYFESKLFSRVQKPTVCFWYVDDTLPSLNKRVTLTIFWSRLIVYIVLTSSRLKKNIMGNFHF